MMMRYLVFIFMIMISACGFQPLYQQGGNNGNIAQKLSDIKIANIPERQGQILHNHLLDLFNPRGRVRSSSLALKTALDLKVDKVGIDRDTTATIFEVKAKANYGLYSESILLKEFTTRLSASFAADRLNNYATDVAIDNARDNILKSLAQEMRNKVGLFLSKNTNILSYE